MISLDRLEIPNLGFSRIFVIARIRYKNRCELINILFNLHQSVHPLLGPYSAPCNFSRLDNVALNFTGISRGTNDAGANLTVSIFARNYNVLRISSGVSGLAYSV